MLRRAGLRGFAGPYRAGSRGERDRQGLRVFGEDTIHFCVHDSGESEIRNLGNSLVEEDIGRLDVTVDDFLLVEPLETFYNMLNEDHGLELAMRGADIPRSAVYPPFFAYNL